MPDNLALPLIHLPDDHSYIAAFLTMACPYHCHYCINDFGSTRTGGAIMSADDWVAGLSRLTNLDRQEGEVPITLQGGEPSVHPEFYEIINRVPDRIKIDLLTNLSFDVEEMIARVDPDRLRRDALYASIRISYHPDQVELDELLAKTHRLLEANFSVGIWAVMHPEQVDIVLAAQERARGEGIDFRTKDFLGYHQGKLYGQYKYPNACSGRTNEQVLCRTTELLIGPDGSIYRCHHDLYEKLQPIGHILDADYQIDERFLPCDNYGCCNPCDVKIKTNRLQQFGHTSVAIKFRESEQHLFAFGKQVCL